MQYSLFLTRQCVSTQKPVTAKVRRGEFGFSMRQRAVKRNDVFEFNCVKCLLVSASKTCTKKGEGVKRRGGWRKKGGRKRCGLGKRGKQVALSDNARLRDYCGCFDFNFSFVFH